MYNFVITSAVLQLELYSNYIDVSIRYTIYMNRLDLYIFKKKNSLNSFDV